MSKSTRLSDLQSISEVNNSTKPLVQDILREIQQEDNAAPSNPQGELNPPLIEGEMLNNESEPISLPQENQMVDNSDPNQYAQQQEQALQYQIDPNINQSGENLVRTPELEMTSNDNMYEQVSTNMQTQEMQNMSNIKLQPRDIGSTIVNKSNNHSQTIFEQLREPLLVMLITILLSIPILSNYLNLAISKIPGNHITLVPIALKALLAGLLFFGIRKLF
jgi:hypothetical protein